MSIVCDKPVALEEAGKCRVSVFLFVCLSVFTKPRGFGDLCSLTRDETSALLWKCRIPTTGGGDSVAQSCLTFCDPMDCSTPGLPVLHSLPEFAQTHVHWVGDAIQPCHPLLPPSPLALHLSQHQSFPMSWLSESGGQGIGASASVLPMNI